MKGVGKGFSSSGPTNVDANYDDDDDNDDDDDDDDDGDDDGGGGDDDNAGGEEEERHKTDFYTCCQILSLCQRPLLVLRAVLCAKEEMGRKLIFTKSFCQTQDISAPHMVNVTKGNPQVKDLGPNLTLKFTISKLHNLFFSGERVLLCHK